MGLPFIQEFDSIMVEVMSWDEMDEFFIRLKRLEIEHLAQQSDKYVSKSGGKSIIKGTQIFNLCLFSCVPDLGRV